jgi:hypothetical protein
MTCVQRGAVLRIVRRFERGHASYARGYASYARSRIAMWHFDSLLDFCCGLRSAAEAAVREWRAESKAFYGSLQKFSSLQWLA